MQYCISPNLMKKLNLGWPEDEDIFIRFSFWVNYFISSVQIKLNLFHNY